jgi:hypothetical protein
VSFTKPSSSGTLCTVRRRGRPVRKIAGRSAIPFMASIALMCGLSSSTEASTPLAYTTAGKWILTGEDGQCYLERTYSNGSSALNLRIDQFPGQYGFRITAAFQSASGNRADVPARIGPNGRASATMVMPINIFDGPDGYRVYRIYLSQDDFDRAAKSGNLFVLPVRHVGLQIAVPQLALAIIQLRRCEQMLLETSGISPESIRNIQSFPEFKRVLKSGLDLWMRVDKDADPDDRAVARAIIDETGLPTSCEVIHRAKSPNLNAESCRRIMNMKFSPAIDKAGKAVAAPFFLESGW